MYFIFFHWQIGVINLTKFKKHRREKKKKKTSASGTRQETLKIYSLKTNINMGICFTGIFILFHRFFFFFPQENKTWIKNRTFAVKNSLNCWKDKPTYCVWMLSGFLTSLTLNAYVPRQNAYKNVKNGPCENKKLASL